MKREAILGWLCGVRPERRQPAAEVGQQRRMPVQKAEPWNRENLSSKQELGLIEHEIQIQIAQEREGRPAIRIRDAIHRNPLFASGSNDASWIESAEDSHPQSKSERNNEPEWFENEPIRKQ
ncbi:MAG TPA: hypothetical protein VFR10_14305 [bacterium]|nr:hypothetical protein [bacterium]